MSFSPKLLQKNLLVLSRSMSSSNHLTSDEVRRYPLFYKQIDDDRCIDYQKLVGVTSILKQTKKIEDLIILEKWKKKMIREMGVERFERMQKDTLEQGTELHGAIQQFLCGDTPFDSIEVSTSVKPLWKSVQPILKNITNVYMVEKKVHHKHLGYHGYVDCVAEYNGEPCIIDWKTSKKTRYNLKDCYDDPIQIAAYIGSFNATENTQIETGLVVKIYYNGNSASAFRMNQFVLNYYWNEWLSKLSDYHFTKK